MALPSGDANFPSRALWPKTVAVDIAGDYGRRSVNSSAIANGANSTASR